MKKEIATHIFCSLLLLLFAYAALSKLANYTMFRAQLVKFPWVGSYAGFIAWLVPAIEFVTVLLLFFPSTVLYGLFFSLVLLVFFTAFLICMLIFSPALPCSCGGVIALLSWKQHIIFNVFFLAISITGIYLKRRSENIPGT